MRILSWNVNGIRAILRKSFLEWLSATSPDILCLQETKAQPNQLPQEIIEALDYQVYWSSAERKGYSGVATLTKIKPQKTVQGFGISRYDLEGRTLVTEYPGFILFNVYFPNGKMSKQRLQYKLDFYEDFLKHIDKLKTKGKKLIITGDFNTAHKPIDLARPKENEKISGFLPIEREWLDKLVAHGYHDTFRYCKGDSIAYSWWDYKSRARERNVGWRIDYFFVTENLLSSVKDAFIMAEVMGSDHCPVGLDLNQTMVHDK